MHRFETFSSDDAQVSQAYWAVDKDRRGCIRFCQLETLLFHLGVFRLAGDTSARSKIALLKSNEAKKRFLDEVRAVILRSVASVFHRVLQSDK